MQLRRYTVRPEQAKSDLVSFIASQTGGSRRAAKTLIDSRSVFVNGKRVWMARHTLAHGDVVEMPGADAPARDARPRCRTPVLHRDDSYLVVDKPAGILSNGPDSLEEGLQRELDMPALKACHRLDRDTSGCLLLAASPDAFDRIVELFQGHAVTKMYHALVAGRFPQVKDTISAPVDGQAATTKVRLLDSTRTASHLLLRIETGRTHQIRKHLAGVMHPVIGDKQYAGSAALPPEFRAVARQMLHAYGLAFRHPVTGTSVRVTSPLPADFRACMQALRLT